MKTRIVHAQAFIEDKTRDVENTKTERVASNAEPKIKTKKRNSQFDFSFLSWNTRLSSFFFTHIIS